MKRSVLRSVVLAALGGATVSCSESATGNDGPERFFGRWQKLEESLPPVTLEVRRESGAIVGQVWLSGVTYTLPAVVDDTSVVLANPASSALAPFVAVIRANGTLRATLRSNPNGFADVTATLHKLP